MRHIIKAAISLLLAMILCLGYVQAFAATFATAEAGTDSLDDHLILYSSFDAENANDDSGNEHNGTVVGNPQFVDGIAGKALKIEGQTNAGKTTAATVYVTYGDSAAIIPDTTDFSYSVFYRSTGETPKWSTILSNKDYYKVENGNKTNTYKGLFSSITLDGEAVTINDGSVTGQGWGNSIDIIVASLNLTKGTHVITFTRTTDTATNNNYNIWGVGFITPNDVVINLGSEQ